jgi:hypothetical protein
MCFRESLCRKRVGKGVIFNTNELGFFWSIRGTGEATYAYQVTCPVLYRGYLQHVADWRYQYRPNPSIQTRPMETITTSPTAPRSVGWQARTARPGETTSRDAPYMHVSNYINCRCGTKKDDHLDCTPYNVSIESISRAVRVYCDDTDAMMGPLFVVWPWAICA